MKMFSMMGAALVLAFVAHAAMAEEGGDAKAKTQEIAGTVGCAHCSYSASLKNVEHCGAAFKSGDTVYLLKASEKADEATKAQVQKFKKELKGDFIITGTVTEEGGNKILVAEAIKPKK
ncbi:MAG: hypothetical protein KIS92_04560 [Planctomycetota bacterium]|nr:hypothetical protein [Planctomycetota bacterium]